MVLVGQLAGVAPLFSWPTGPGSLPDLARGGRAALGFLPANGREEDHARLAAAEAAILRIDERRDEEWRDLDLEDTRLDFEPTA